MLQVGQRRSQARETSVSRAANKRFRNLNSAVLMQRLTMSGEVIRLGLGSTHLAVVQVLAAHTPRDGWRLEGEGASERIVSGEVYPTVRTIGEKVGRSERQVHTIIRQLEEVGMIAKRTEVIRRPDALGGTITTRRNTYRIALPTLCAADGADGVRNALAESTQLRLSRPDTFAESQGRTGNQPQGVPEVGFRYPPLKLPKNLLSLLILLLLLLLRLRR